jgi:RNA polymerase sigma-70 factor, ECF subfamily
LIEQVEPMVPALHRYARALLPDRDLADDLIQDCLERVISRCDQRRGSDDTRQWVFAIAHNLAMDCLRQRARRGAHAPIDDVQEAEMAIPATQEEHIARQDLLWLLESLPHAQRSVIFLVSVEDLTTRAAVGTGFLDILSPTFARSRFPTSQSRDTASWAAALSRRITVPPACSSMTVRTARAWPRSSGR